MLEGSYVKHIQYKLVQNRIETNEKCNASPETIYAFIGCARVSAMWREIDIWLAEKNSNMNVSDIETCFGETGNTCCRKTNFGNKKVVYNNKRIDHLKGRERKYCREFYANMGICI